MRLNLEINATPEGKPEGKPEPNSARTAGEPRPQAFKAALDALMRQYGISKDEVIRLLDILDEQARETRLKHH